MKPIVLKSTSYGVIILTIFFGFFLNIFPFGNSNWVPDFMLVVITFWVMQVPEKMDLTPAFFLGVLMDIQTSQYLGIHAITYLVACFLVIVWDRRLLNNTLLGQSFVMFQIFLIANATQLFILWQMGTIREFSASYFMFPCVLQACLWPVLKKILSGHPAPIHHNPL